MRTSGLGIHCLALLVFLGFVFFLFWVSVLGFRSGGYENIYENFYVQRYKNLCLGNFYKMTS
jgi:hypothetical protein